LPREAISQGRWVAARDAADWTMYHIPRFLMPNWSAKRVWKAFEREQFPALFANQVVGMPATSGELMIDEEVMARLIGTVQGQAQDPGPCFAGIDVGRDLHVVIGRIGSEGRHDYLWVGKTDWAGLPRLLSLFNVRQAIIDALPETTKAQELARAFPHRVRLAYYTNQPIKGDQPVKLYDDQARVDLDRTVTLDRSADRLILQQDGFPLLPHDDRQEFVSQMTAMMRGIEDDAHGVPVPFWREIRADHYRHAHNYATVAAGILAGITMHVSYITQGTGTSGPVLRVPDSQQIGAQPEEKEELRDSLGRPVTSGEIRRYRSKVPPGA